MMQAPKGYTFCSFFLNGSNVRSLDLLICDRCGALVEITTRHDAFHSRTDERFGVVRYTNVGERTDSPPTTLSEEMESIPKEYLMDQSMLLPHRTPAQIPTVLNSDKDTNEPRT